jgi:flavin-dependent dehydrogenase
LLARRKALQESGGSPEKLLETVGRDNADFARLMSEAAPVDGTLMVISQIPFRPKRQVVKGVLMAGDSAGVMPPFLGIGVAAALRSGWACGQVMGRWVEGDLEFHAASRIYETWWRHGFQTSQKWGNVASRMLCRRSAGSVVVGALNLFPKLGDLYYRRTRIQIPALPQN